MASGAVASFTRRGRALRGPVAARLNVWVVLSLPGVAFLLAFFVVPLIGMVVRSFTDPSPRNYAVFAESSLYGRVLWTTIWTSLLVTVLCLLIAYPYAYAMHIAGAKLRAVLIAFVLVSMWSSLLVRTYAWTVLLQDTGLVNDALRKLRVVDEPLPLIRSTFGVVIGMTQILVPFMVFPIYALMRRIDPDLVRAAANLGATPRKAFRRVFLPLSIPGVLAGCLLVYVLAMGFYITPALLGGPQNRLFGQLIADQVNVLLRFGVASALSVILMGVTFLVLAIGSRAVSVRATLGFEGREL